MRITKPAIAATAVAAMSRRPALAVAVLAVGFTLSACGGSSSSSDAPHTTTSHTTAALAVDPTAACLQLHDWQLHNNGQGVSAAFGQQLEAETRGTQLGTDIVQWLQDLGVNPEQFSSSGVGAIESYTTQLVSDAATVGADCEEYGVRNLLGVSS